MAQNLSRRNFLKTSAIVGGVAATGASFAQLFGYKEVFAQGAGDDIQTILNLAATAETLACTHYNNVLTDSNIALVPAEVQFLKSALDTERQHLDFLLANGAKQLATEFYFPLNVYTDRNQFSAITETAEQAFVGAYLAAVRRISELGNSLLAGTAAQVAVTEQVHLALIRQIGGRVPNHVSLGQAVFFNTSDALPVLQGFLEGGDGFVTTTSKFPGNEVIATTVGSDGVESVLPMVDPNAFSGAMATMDATMDGTMMMGTMEATATN